MSEPSNTTPRGWYTDPHDPTKDRWWDGANWTDYLHRGASMRRSMFGAGYARMWWAGPNRAAGRSLLFARIAIGVLLVALLISATLLAPAHAHAGIGAVLTCSALVLIAAVLGLVGIVFGILGVRVAAERGALLVAIWGLGASTVISLMSLTFVVLLIVSVVRG
jgi:hypothetical protein